MEDHHLDLIELFKCYMTMTCCGIVIFVIICVCLYIDQDAYWELVELIPDLHAPTLATAILYSLISCS